MLLTANQGPISIDAVPGNFRPELGTVAVWVRPHRNGGDATPRYVFCIYGQRDLPHSYAVNRWNVAFGGGKCTFTIYTQTEGKTFSVSAPISNWKPGEWHHVAATWANVNSGKANGEIRLYLDGAPAEGLAEKQIDVGPTDDVMAIGRDQDGSPDYGDADFDDLFIYGRALTADEIAKGVKTVKGGTRYDLPPMPGVHVMINGWWNSAWPFRVEVTLPPQDAPREDVFVQCPLTVGAGMAALGTAGSLNYKSLTVIEEDGNRPIPVRVEDNYAEWQAPGPTPAGEERRFWIYFQVHRYQIIEPLVSGRLASYAAAPPVPPSPPDYATLTYGKPWDFNDGAFCGIDQWGNKPEFVRNKKVINGILSMDVSDDAYFIWGDMWGQVPKVNQKVSIDLDKFPVLEMKVRQSGGRANWKLFGRPGMSERLLTHDFVVTGTGWQRVRIDLKKDARWRGVLTALRIDPSKQQPAHIEIDWVRLTAVTPVEHGSLQTIPNPISMLGPIKMVIPETSVAAGARQEVVVKVTEPGGEGVSGQPVVLELGRGSGGFLEASERHKSIALGPQARRAVTDKTGCVSMLYMASAKAAQSADMLVARVEFASVPETRATVNTHAGPPHHYRVEPAKVMALKSSDLPLSVSAQLVDEFDNPVGETRKLTWSSDDGATITPDGTWKGDERKRWVYRVRVKDEQGLTGESEAICLLPSQPRTDPIVLGPNGYFRKAKEGKGWIPLGGFYANWVGLPEGGEEGRKLISFVDATEEEMAHWLDFLASQGVTAMRFMLRAHTKRGMEPMDVIGRVNMPLFAKVLRYMDLARKHDIRFMLTVHEDYTKPAYYDGRALENFCIPQYEGEDLDKLSAHQRRFIRDKKLIGIIEEKYTDPDVMACQDQYARQLVALLKDNPQLFSWEFENEMVNCPQSWANHMAEVIRSVDPVTPICASHGGGGIHTADPLWWTRDTSIDFYTYHLYPHTGSTSPELDYGAAVDVLTCYGRMAGACMLGESAGDEFSQYPKDRDADRRYLMRDIIWFSLVDGNPGCFFWNARGFEVEQFRLANKIASGLEWRDWLRQRPDIGIVVAHPWDDDKYYRSKDGLADYAMMGRYAQHYLSAGADFDFTTDGLGYAKTATLKTFAPPAGTPRVAVSPGWQVRANTREGCREGLAYVRNFAGIRHWQQPKINMYIRDRKPAPLKIRFDLPVEKMGVAATDLDTGAEKRFEVGGQGEVDLGVAEHDWALVWRQQ